jgi:serine/threonine-protein kinase RsbW
MQRLYGSTGVSDFQAHLPILNFHRVIHSDARLVDETVQEMTAVLNRLDWLDDIELVALTIQEALTNALVHGNRCDPEKTIGISISLNGASLFVSVNDSGSGFDPSGVPDPLAAENLLNTHGRGIFLMRHVMDEVEFNFDRGTEVRMRRSQKWFE